MKRIRIGASLPALLFITPLGGGFVLLHGCVPDADTSGLPPYDAGLPAEDVTTIIPEAGGEDAGPDTGTDAADTGVAEASTGTATIVGVVLDYTQGLGAGVVPGATVSVINGPTATAGLDGTFTLTGVAAGRVQINVAHPVTVAFSGNSSPPIVYSTTQVVLANVVGGQTVTIEPVLHEGCAGLVQMGPTGNPADGGSSTTLLTANCGSSNQGQRNGSTITGNYVAVSFKDPNSLVNAASGAAYTGLARVEMIPLAFPSTTAQLPVTDFTWGAGLPGQATQVDTVGAAEIRVVDDATGNPLSIAAGESVTLTIPVTPATTAASLQQGNYQPWFYDAVGGDWVLDTGGAALAVTPAKINGANTINITAPHLTWWGVTSPIALPSDGGAPTTGCFTGTLMAGSAPAAGVWVHAVGTDWFGAASAVTSAGGTFCVDVKKSSHVQIEAAYAAAPTSVFAVSQAFATQTSGIASCESSQGQACTNLGQIAMQAATPTCVAGTVDQENSPPTTFSLTLTGVLPASALTTADESAGVANSAYIGQVNTGDGGAFCAQVPPGSSFSLVNPPLSSECSAPQWEIQNQPGSMTVPAGQAAAACGAAGCFDAGDIFYGCY